jgi:hypothetical protein
MHQGKRLQSIAAFRINEGLTSWPLSPIYLLLWARYRSSTKRSPNFFGRAPGISEDKLDEGEDAACAPIEDEQSAVAILHSGRVDDDVQQQAERVDQDTAFAAGDLLGRIKALRVKRGAPF